MLCNIKRRENMEKSCETISQMEITQNKIDNAKGRSFIHPHHNRILYDLKKHLYYHISEWRT